MCQFPCFCCMQYCLPMSVLLLPLFQTAYDQEVLHAKEAEPTGISSIGCGINGLGVITPSALTSSVLGLRYNFLPGSGRITPHR